VGATGLLIQPLRSQHSELCYGFILYADGSACGGISCSACDATDGTTAAATTDRTSQLGNGHSAQPLQHSRLVPLLGWSADSGCSRELYSQLVVAPVLLLDARSQGSYEHAGFDELAAALLQGAHHTAEAEEAAASSADDGSQQQDACHSAGLQAGAEAAGGGNGAAAGVGLQNHAGSSHRMPSVAQGSQQQLPEVVAGGAHIAEGSTAGGQAACPAAGEAAPGAAGDVFGSCQQVLITGYGRQVEAPSHEWLQQQSAGAGAADTAQPQLQIARPGMNVKLYRSVSRSFSGTLLIGRAV
jgi:hypothetical protein